MAVMARETWTDERMGDLAAKVDKGFADAKVEVRDLRSDMDKGFADAKVEMRDLRSDMDKGFSTVKGEISELRSELGALQRTMIIGFATIATIAASTVASVIAAALVV